LQINVAEKTTELFSLVIE